ncbi:hypothetical protein PoB_006294100 [Plakobranchus ocellatus]|uniref:Uncharacterized protein n=1 Tax=Plakobranchus ocellatus TaxID=259542 RepID=A0AAV4CXI8_9GAST|nr:hypothetical protein PoB_006294100 [Plakobranchus ocellatus]
MKFITKNPTLKFKNLNVKLKYCHHHHPRRLPLTVSLQLDKAKMILLHRTSYRDVLVQKPSLQQRHLHSGSPSRSSPFHLRTSILLFQKVNLLVRLTTQFFTFQMTLFDLQETHPMFVNMM